MCGVSSNHKDPHIEHVSSGQHDFPLAVRVFVGGIFVECHLGSEAALLSRNCQVDDTNKERLICEASNQKKKKTYQKTKPCYLFNYLPLSKLKCGGKAEPTVLTYKAA